MSSRYQRPNIQAMQGYTWGEQPNNNKVTKLNTNENPYPPSPAAQAALADITIDALRTYPQPTADPLRQLIASQHNIDLNQVVVTNGGDEALRLAFTTFVEPNKSIGVAEPSYSLYPVLAAIQDASIQRVNLDEQWQIPFDFAQQLNQADCQVTCVVNPHAPSGSLYPIEQLSDIAEALDGILLIDEAYVDFVDPKLNYSSVPLINKHDNVLILRSFSKGYGLAGLRLGYLLGCSALIDPIVNKTRDSYNINHISQKIGEAAFLDQAYAQDTWHKVRKARELLQQNLAQLGLVSPKSHTNFILTTVPDEAKLCAEELYLALKEAGILVRYFNAPGLSNKLRITIGTPEQNQQLIETISDLLTT